MAHSDKEIMMEDTIMEYKAFPQLGELSGEEHPAAHFEREDGHWRAGAQARDWLVLVMMMAIYLAWTGIVYFFEPGIR
jgi:hypothetical protein